jgi:hypothetical protein
MFFALSVFLLDVQAAKCINEPLVEIEVLSLNWSNYQLQKTECAINKYESIESVEIIDKKLTNRKIIFDGYSVLDYLVSNNSLFVLLFRLDSTGGILLSLDKSNKIQGIEVGRDLIWSNYLGIKNSLIFNLTDIDRNDSLRYKNKIIYPYIKKAVSGLFFSATLNENGVFAVDLNVKVKSNYIKLIDHFLLNFKKIPSNHEKLDTAIFFSYELLAYSR